MQNIDESSEISCSLEEKTVDSPTSTTYSTFTEEAALYKINQAQTENGFFFSLTREDSSKDVETSVMEWFRERGIRSG